jgi:hypothetical protein
VSQELIERIQGMDSDVNFEPVAKLRSQLLRRPSGSIGIVFSRKGFTEPAKIMTRFAMPQTILLWEGLELEFALEEERILAGLWRKYRHAVEYGVPDYNLRTGELV